MVHVITVDNEVLLGPVNGPLLYHKSLTRPKLLLTDQTSSKKMCSFTISVHLQEVHIMPRTRALITDHMILLE